MLKFPKDLDGLRAVMEADRWAWHLGDDDSWESTHEFWEIRSAWPPVSREALNKIPNAEFLAARDREFAEEHPDVPVNDILEALRHFRVLDRFHQPDTLFWDQVFHTRRTWSALELFTEFCDSAVSDVLELHFLNDLIYRSEIGEYLIEGNAYGLGNWQLSIPWSVIMSGVVPEGLIRFGRHLNSDSIYPNKYNNFRRGSLELKIHDCPSSNPWLLPQTRAFLLDIADKWGWYTALDEKYVNPYVFYATCVDPIRIDEAGFQKQPLELAAAETARMGINLLRLHEDGEERVTSIARTFEEAIYREMEFPTADSG